MNVLGNFLLKEKREREKEKKIFLLFRSFAYVFMVSNMASSVGIPVMLNGWNVCTVHNVGVAAVEVCPMVALLTVITPY